MKRIDQLPAGSQLRAMFHQETPEGINQLQLVNRKSGD